MKFPIGSGKNVIEMAKNFADKYGWNRLAKLPTNFITSRSEDNALFLIILPFSAQIA
jgi:ribonuclease HIII